MTVEYMWRRGRKEKEATLSVCLGVTAFTQRETPQNVTWLGWTPKNSEKLNVTESGSKFTIVKNALNINIQQSKMMSIFCFYLRHLRLSQFFLFFLQYLLVASDSINYTDTSIPLYLTTLSLSITCTFWRLTFLKNQARIYIKP